MNGATKRVFYVSFLAHEDYIRVLDRCSDVQLDRLENDSPDHVALPVLRAAHAYQVNSARGELSSRYLPDRALFECAPNLLIVSTSGAGYDSVNVKACTDAGVLVVNQAGGNKEAVAEHVLGMLLCLSKRIIESDRTMRRQTAINRNHFMGHDALGKTIGIIGLGNVGTRVAELCRGLLSMRVLAYDPYVSETEMQERGVEKVEFDELLRRSDYVSVNCPLTDETRGFIGAREFALMQRHALFITTARGKIHDEAALVGALQTRSIAGAGLDVWATEPPPLDHPLLQFDNVVASPHTAGVTEEARRNIARIAAENLLDALDGKRPARIVNPEVWPRYRQRFSRVFGVLPE